jgi:hypothetical protein
LSYPPDVKKTLDEGSKNNFLEKMKENNNERISEKYIINRISIDSDSNKN